MIRISAFTQNFWVFWFYIADFWQTFWVIWENGSNWSNLRLKMSFFALGRLKNHKVPHLHPNSTMFMPLDRLQLKMYAFSGKFNVCSKRVLLSWIKICRDFTLQTQIFTQKYRSWLRFYSEFLRKKLAAGGSARERFYPERFLSLVWGVGSLVRSEQQGLPSHRLGDSSESCGTCSGLSCGCQSWCGDPA